MMMFISEITMSVTHDMKNYLAIINENVGLLEDLFQRDLTRALAQDLDKSVSGKIKNQIGRSDRILKKLNRFANNLAPDKAVTDLEACLDLVLDLCNGITRNHGVRFRVSPPQTRIYLDDPPFLLHLLLFRAVKFCLSAAKENKEPHLVFGSDNGRPGLTFITGPLPPGLMDELFAAPEEIDLIRLLNVRVNKDMENGFALEWIG